MITALLIGVVPVGAQAAPAALAVAHDLDHPLVMQQAAQAEARAPVGTLKPGARAAPLRASSAPSPGAGAARQTTRPLREVFGFGLLSSIADPTYGYPSWNFDLLTTVALFGLNVDGNTGNWQTDSSWTTWNSSLVTDATNAAHSHGTKVVMTAIFQDFSSGNPFMCSALYNRATTARNIAAQVVAKNLDGVNIDYEGLNGNCTFADGKHLESDLLRDFVRQVRAALPAGSYLSVDTYGASAEDPGNFFDIAGLNAYADSFFVMSYDQDYSNYHSAPLYCSSYCFNPVGALTGYRYNDHDEVAQYVSLLGSGSKVILGVPYYGRKGCVGAAVPNATSIPSPVTHMYETGSPMYLDSSTVPGTPGVSSYSTARDPHDPSATYGTWYSSDFGCTREQYWDDVGSLAQKYDLVNVAGLRGVGFWTLNYGGAAPELWNLIAAKFSNLPGSPLNVIADAGDVSATLSWTPSSVNASGLTKYQVTAQPGNLTWIVPWNLPYTVVAGNGLVNGTTYQFTVSGINGAGVGPASAASNAVAPTAAARHRSYFAEGTERVGFHEYLTISNSGLAGTATLIYYFSDSVLPYRQAIQVPASGRATVDTAAVVATGRDFSLVVDSTTPTLVAERPIYWSGCVGGVCGSGGDTVIGGKPSQTWYFAEGYTGAGVQEYITVTNPGEATVNARADYYSQDGTVLPSHPFTVQAGTRVTLNVNQDVGPGRSVSAFVHADGLILAERPIYFAACLGSVCANGVHDSFGAQPATSAYFAEGHIGDGYQEFLSLLNPTGATITVAATYFFGSNQGSPMGRAYSIGPYSRATVDVNATVASTRDVSVQLSSTSQFVAERPMYFSSCAPAGFCFNGGHDATGSTPAPTWYFAEGYTGTGFQEWLTVANPGPSDGFVSATFLFNDGSAAAVWTGAAIPARSRLTLNLNALLGANRSSGMIVSANVPVVAERPMYFNACPGGLCIDGGSDAVGASSLP